MSGRRTQDWCQNLNPTDRETEGTLHNFPQNACKQLTERYSVHKERTALGGKVTYELLEMKETKIFTE
jgi:hypothetical protein